MKLSTFKWLSGAIIAPLFITTLSIPLSATATPIERSKSLAHIDDSRVTALNLIIPVEASIAPSNPRRQSSSKQSRNDAKTAVLNLSIAPNKSSVNSLNLRSLPKNRVATNPKSNQKIVPSNKQYLREISRSSVGGNYLRLVKYSNNGTNDIGNPIYTLEIYIDGELDRRFNAVSGTATSQKADRNLGNNHAPLPDGLYDVNNWITPGTLREVDRTFIGIVPKFKTNRNDLGIHLDPSFNKRNGYDGTSGCIGLTTAEDRDALNNFVLKYRPRNLVVKILAAEERE